MMLKTIHALTEALRTGAPLQIIWVSTGRQDPRTRGLIRDCLARGLSVRHIPPQAFDRLCAPPHQGVCAELAPIALLELDQLLPQDRPGLVLALNGITDVGNLGAIIRSGVAAGVDGFLLSGNRSAPLSDQIMTTSAGTLHHARIVPSSRMAQDLKTLQDQGCWVVATSPRATQNHWEQDWTLPCVLLMGGEQNGLPDHLLRLADATVRIPFQPRVESLNVSVATGILLFEALRQRTLARSVPVGT